MTRTLWLGDFFSSTNQLCMTFGVDDLRFNTSYWYSDLDLLQLERDHGRPFFRKMVFHIAAFEANKLGSLAPDVFDLGPFADLHTEEFATLWSTIFRRVWAQWRYENNLPSYHGPRIFGAKQKVASRVAIRGRAEVETLVFCGGGKDSLVAMRLVEQAGIPYSSYAYSHSIYASATNQHQLLDRLLDVCRPARRHRHWIVEDFMDSPVLELRPEYGIGSLTAAETPSSVFGAIPLALSRGYRHLAVAHERSSDHGNLVWPVTGEEINHQWGKSLEAEVLMANYIRSELVADLDYFSVLAPLYDVVIFNLLGEYLDAVGRTHSCNLRKPWCEECAKCAYVWINYMAYLPPEVVLPMFRSNLLDNPKNEIWFRQMLGLEEHSPFECVGQIDEARLAFALCQRRGLRGRAMELYEREISAVNFEEIVRRWTQVDPAYSAMPPEIHDKLMPLLVEGGQLARQKMLAQGAARTEA